MDNKSLEDSSEKTENCIEGQSTNVKHELLLRSKDDGTSGHLNSPQTADHLEKEWICGDVIWARISGHPFWPGMVTIDPNNGLFVKMRKGRGEAMSKVYHVQYFSDRGSHSWVSANQILAYEGETKLRDLALTKKKEKKFVGAVPDPKSSNAFKWQCAVKEADDALLTTRQDRLVFFEECFPVMIVDKGKGSKHLESKENDGVVVHPSTSGTSSKQTVVNDKEKETKPISKSKDQRAVESPLKKKTGGETESAGKVLEKQDTPSANLGKKRKRSEDRVSDSDNTPGRDTKLESEYALRRGNKRTKKARMNKSTTTTVKAKLKNGKGKKFNYKSTNHVKPKLKYKKKHKNEPGNFEVFFVKSYSHCIEMNAKFADDNDALRVYLLKMWETLNDSEKSKFNEFSAMCS